MKRLICIFCILGFAGSIWAERNPYYDNWLTSERLERWQNLSQDMDAHDLYTLIEEMYHLPREPWPESTKTILLKMTQLHRQRWLDKRAGKPIIVPEIAIGGCGEIDAQLDEMVSWQNDPRFIDFQSNFLGQGSAARGLARIGEPAFEAIIKALEEDTAYPTYAIDILMENKNSYLRQHPMKLSRVRRILIEIARPNTDGRKKSGRFHAISTLRYFPNPEVITLLETISLTDTKLRSGKYYLRTGARESLEFMRNN